MAITIFVPTEGAPFITSEQPETIVGGYIEAFNIVPNIQDLVVHPLFLQPSSCNNDGSNKRWAVVDRILRRKILKKSIWVNENGMEKCCPNFAMIAVRVASRQPLFGDICIQIRTKDYEKHFKDLLPYYRTFKDFQKSQQEAAEGGECEDSSRYHECYETGYKIDCENDPFFILTKDGEEDRYLCQEAFEDEHLLERLMGEGWECDDWD